MGSFASFRYYANLFLESVLIERCCWKLSRVDTKSSSSLVSRSLMSIMIGLLKSWIRSWINRFPSSSNSSLSLLVGVCWRPFSKLNLTRASRLLCLRDWNCLRRSWNSSSSEELPRRIRSRIFECLTSSDTCFFDWKALRLSVANKWFRSCLEGIYHLIICLHESESGTRLLPLEYPYGQHWWPSFSGIAVVDPQSCPRRCWRASVRRILWNFWVCHPCCRRSAVSNVFRERYRLGWWPPDLGPVARCRSMFRHSLILDWTHVCWTLAADCCSVWWQVVRCWER